MESNEGLSLSSSFESDVEATLITANEKPASTDELKDMLKEAGTELTIKYITGQMTFEDFFKELEKKRAKKRLKEISKPIPSTSETSTSSETPKYKWLPNIPHFEELMEDVSEGDESEEEEIEDIVDSGELEDKRDKDWTPNRQEIRELKKADEKDSNLEQGLQIRKKWRKPRRPVYEIPKNLAGQNGQAMLLRAQGKIEEAMMLLYNIIEKAPQAAAPFKTLGSIHEEKGDIEQALKFYMVSANLKKSDVNEWFDLSDMWMELNDEKMVLMCYRKAYHYAKNNADKLDALSRRILHYEKFNYSLKTILMTKDMMIPFMSKSEPDKVLDFARNVAKEFIELEEINTAIFCMLDYFKELSNQIDSEDVHLLVELLMSQKNFQKPIEIIVKLCGVEIEISSNHIDASNVEKFVADNSKISGITRLSVPPVMPIDLKCKLIQCLLLGKIVESVSVLKDLLSEIQSTDVEEYGDVHFDIAETLADCGHIEEAKTLLEYLLISDTFNKAAVWLTYGQCLNSLGKITEAVGAYEKVLEMAPGHYDARVTLSSLKQQIGQHEQALELLSKDPTRDNGTSTDQLLLLRKCQLLHSQGKNEEFIVAAQQLLSFNLRGQFRPDFIKAILNARTTKHRVKLFPKFVEMNNSFLPGDSSATVLGEQLSDLEKSEQIKFRKQIWDIYLKLCLEMHSRNRLDELMESSILAISCPIFSFNHVDSRSLDAEFLCFKICVLGRNKHFVNSISKAVILKAITRNQAWNLYCFIGTLFKSVIDLRFAMRALMKDPENLALRMLNGSARLISGSYKQALGEYISIFRKDPHNPLVLLCCGLCFIHIATQSFSDKRNWLLAQVLCLLNAYKGARGECQEVYYNMGRAMQQLNVTWAAVYFYNKVLELPSMVEDKRGTYDLKQEAAFNLSLMYKQSGNDELARHMIQTYCII